MKLATLTAIASIAATSAFGAGSGDHSHGGAMEMMEVGKPGDRAAVTRTVEFHMIETDDGEMLFEPQGTTIETLAFTAGETVLFKIKNNGELDHEFVLDTVPNNDKHRELMMEFPEMEHDDPNSITLAPGETGEIIWTFANAGNFQFACLIPGHMESGMYGPIDVAQADTERPYTKGVVKKIKADAGKVTIIHEELVELGMPAMTMVFRADENIIGQLSEGQEIEFLADRVKGKLAVTGLK
jgi:uncharacterized cupredoxin-like copper-binding protein